MIRITNCIKHYRKKDIVNYYKVKQLKRIQKKIEMNENIKNDRENDHTNLNSIIYLGVVLKLTELLTLIFFLSYFCAVIWLVICELQYEYSVQSDYIWANDNFFVYYRIGPDFNKYSKIQTVIIAFYFMNTSLSTIGFGDFKPISDAERLVCVVMVICGVILFSYIMN